MKTKKYNIFRLSIFHSQTLQQLEHFEAMSFCISNYLARFFPFTFLDLSTIFTWQQSPRVTYGILKYCAAATNAYGNMLMTSNDSFHVILTEY